MRVLDLFSGIGGFSLGLRLAGGFETVQFCEIDPWCRQVLAKNFPGVPIHDDIRSFRPSAGCADVVVGGTPCQPFSVAGKQRGTADDRDLWPEMRRVIEAVRPTWVIGENVAGFVRMELERSIADLEALGYTVWPVLIPACGVDAPHRRERVWILGYADGHREPAMPVNDEAPRREVMGHTGAVADASSRRQCGQGSREGEQPWRAEIVSGSEALADAWSAGLQGHAGHGDERDEPGRQQPDPNRSTSLVGVRSGTDPERRWLPEPPVGRVANGIPRRVDRLRGLGNAVVPQVVAEIGRAILAAEHDQQAA